MSSSHQPEQSTSHRRQQRQDRDDSVRGAPYLTHVVAHHGQLTLIPPQNAGRIRKPPKKKKQGSTRDRLDDEEPRFTTAVPPSSSRKLHPAPAHVRTRKHAISSPAGPSPSTSRRYDAIIDDQSIPDYPPPSFEDAIASPHVAQHHPSSATDSAYARSQSNQTTPQAVQSMTPSVRSTSVPTSTPPTTLQPLHDSPAVSQMSLARSVDPHSISPFPHARSLAPAPSPLACSSSATLSSSATVLSESTAFTDTPLLRPPQPRSVPHSSAVHSAPLPREREWFPAGPPYRLTSPSTTTLLSAAHAHALRDSPAISQDSLDSPAPPSPVPSEATSPPSPYPLSPIVSELSASAPSSPQSRDSVSTASDVFEEFTWDPRQRWSADRRLGYSLEERVQREFDRRNTQEALSAFGGASSSSAPVDQHTKRCSHCGSLRPLECGDIQSIDEVSDEEDEEGEDEHASRHSPLPGIEKGKSPYLHPGASSSKATMFMTRSQIWLKSHSPEPSSPPSSPLSPSTSFFKNPSAWASTVTLSLASALGNNHHGNEKTDGVAAVQNGKPLKRRESFGVKRLFGSLKGKEREREHSRSQSLPHPIPGSTVHLTASFVSSSDSSSITESIEGWEVVGVEEDSVHSSTSAHSNTQSTAPTSPARSIPESVSTSPTSPTTEHARQAFINRPVRHRHSPGESPATLLTLSPPALVPVPVVSTPTAATMPALVRPLLPEKSPLRRLASAGQPRQARIQPPGTPITSSAPLPLPMTPSPFKSSPPLVSGPMTPTTPTSGSGMGASRALKPSPSVVWKPAPSPPRSPLSRTPTSGSPIRISPFKSGAHASMPPVPVHGAMPQPQRHPQLASSTPVGVGQGHLQAPVHPAIAMLSRSEKNALRHQSAPLPMAMTMTMTVPGESVTVQPQRESRTPVTVTPRSYTDASPSPLVEAHLHLRRRRAITPPPSHRKAMHPLESDEDFDLAHVSNAAPIVVVSRPSTSVEEASEPEAESERVPETNRECASIEQLMDSYEARPSPRLVPIAGPRPRPRSHSPSPVSTPTTPTFPAGASANQGQPQHYHGRPLPQVPEQERGRARFSIPVPIPVKRVPDEYPVNRMPEAQAQDPPPPLEAEVSLPPSRSPSPSPATSPVSVLAFPLPPPAPPAPAHMQPSPVVPAAPETMERSTSGGSVLEDVRSDGAAIDESGVEDREETEAPRPEFLQITDLDLLASRALEGAEDGRNYDDLLLVSQVMGPAAAPSAAHTQAAAEKQTVPYTGNIEVKRRRVLKDGRVKLKLSLLGLPVDRCGVCLSQFKKDEQAALTPVCKHSFHEVCLRRWLSTSRICPICRVALSMDD